MYIHVHCTWTCTYSNVHNCPKLLKVAAEFGDGVESSWYLSDDECVRRLNGVPRSSKGRPPGSEHRGGGGLGRDGRRESSQGGWRREYNTWRKWRRVKWRSEGGDGLWGDDGLGDEGGGGGCCDARLLRVVAVSTWRVGKEEN